MLNYLIALPTILIGFVWLWPATYRFLRPIRIETHVTAVAGFGLSVGALSLYMLILGLLPGTWLRPALVLPVPWIVLAYEVWRWKIARGQMAIRFDKNRFRSLTGLLPRSLEAWLSLVCVCGLVVILINTISYPFHRDDVLSRFAPNARLLFVSATIPTTLTGYPLAVQLLYAFAFMAGGSVNDHLAGLVVTSFATAMTLITFSIGSVILTRRPAWMSTILLLSSPLFVDWSTSGYVDVPVGVYHGLSFLFAFLWMEGGNKRSAILTGAMIGLALWTKQSAMVLLPVIGIVPLLRGWPRHNFHAETINGALALTATLLVAGPWYIRTLILAGSGDVLPMPGAYDAQFIDPSLRSLLTFVVDAREWGIIFGSTALVGITLWICNLLEIKVHVRGPVLRRWSALLFAAFVLPYHLIWWQGFSYQTRYLLASAPLYAVLAGYGSDWIVQRLTILLRLSRWAIVLVASALVFLGSYKRIGAVYHLAMHPLQSDDAKLTRISPEAWSLVKHIRATIKPGSRLYVMDGTLAYWLDEYELLQGYPTYLDDLQGNDYFVTAPAGKSVYRFYGTTDNEVLRALGENSILPEVYRHNEEISIYKVILTAP